MRVRRVPGETSDQVTFDLLDEEDEPIPVVTAFRRHLHARGYSPNTLSAYAHDLQHFFRFLAQQGLGYHEFTPAVSLSLL